MCVRESVCVRTDVATARAARRKGEVLVEAGGSRDAAELSAAPLVATVCLSLWVANSKVEHCKTSTVKGRVGR